MKLTNRTEGILEILAALLVLFTSILDPRVSVILVGAALIALAVYRFSQRSST